MSDVPDCTFISDGTVWQPFCSGVLVVPPAIPVSALTAYGASTSNTTLTQEGPFWRLTTSEQLNQVLHAWLVGPLAKDGSGQYTIEIGIDSSDTLLIQPFGTLGIYTDDAVSQGCSWFWYNQGTTLAISAHYYSTIPSYASAAGAVSMGLAPRVKFLRVGYIASSNVTTVDVSTNGTDWFRIFSSPNSWFYNFGAPTTFTRFGIDIDCSNNNNLAAGSSRMSARICHFVQTAGPPPAPVL